MNHRNIEIKVRLNRKEAEALNKKVKKSRISREAYLRHLINGVVPQDAPPPEYFSFRCSKRVTASFAGCFSGNSAAACLLPIHRRRFPTSMI